MATVSAPKTKRENKQPFPCTDIFCPLVTFTCASWPEAVLLRSHCSLSFAEFDIELLKRSYLTANEDLVLDRYKWLHPECNPPAMPFDEGVLRDILVDLDGVSFPSNGDPPVLSLSWSGSSPRKRGRAERDSDADSAFDAFNSVSPTKISRKN